MATLAHALQVVGGWIAPLVIFFVRRESKFVSFHALQALLLQIVHVCFIGIFMAAWLTLIFTTIATHPATKSAPPPFAFFLVFPLVWLGFMGTYALILVLAILYAIKAGRGEWAEYPVLGKLARKMLNIGPGGTVLPGSISS